MILHQNSLQTFKRKKRNCTPDAVCDEKRQENYQTASRTAGRRRYQEWVEILRGMKKIPGGEEKMWEIAEHWRTAYRNRRAMMEELGKL